MRKYIPDLPTLVGIIVAAMLITFLIIQGCGLV